MSLCRGFETAAAAVAGGVLRTELESHGVRTVDLPDRGGWELEGARDARERFEQMLREPRNPSAKWPPPNQELTPSQAITLVAIAGLPDVIGEGPLSSATRSSAAGGGRIAVRNEFVHMALSGVPLPGDPSDRRLSNKEDRPPAARLITPRGAVLRVFLTALFEAQTRTRPGQHPGNTRPLASRAGGVTSWIDLLASDAEPYGTGKHRMSVSAKKTRQMESAIDRLAKEELVELTRTGKPGTKKYEDFLLMHEGGRRPHGPNLPYNVPVVPPEQAFPVPVTLFTNGWIHVLEDTELSFILMMAASHHAMGGQPFTITADNRLLRFGMTHDGYEAHMMLSRLALVTVTPDDRRRPDGTVEDFNSEGIGASPRAQLHPGRLRPRRLHHAQRRNRPAARPRLLAAQPLRTPRRWQRARTPRNTPPAPSPRPARVRDAKPLARA